MSKSIVVLSFTILFLGIPSIFCEAGVNIWTLKSSMVPSTSPYSLLIDPNNPAILYAGLSQGVGKSTDFGLTWTQYKTGLMIPGWGVSRDIREMAIDPTDSSVLYAGTSSLAQSGSVVYGGIFKSTDAGQSWSQSGLSHLRVHSILIDPTQTSVLYLSGIAALSYQSESGIYKSTDSGGSWTPLLLGSFGNIVLHAQALYVTGDAGLYKSTNGGSVWVQIANTDWIGDYLISDPRQDGILYGVTGNRVTKSTNYGTTWRYTSYGGCGVTNCGETDTDLPTNVYIGLDGQNCAGGVYRSADLGESWSFSNSGIEAGGSGDILVRGIIDNPSTPRSLYAVTMWPTGFYSLTCSDDVNDDGYVNLVDLQLILNYLSGMGTLPQGANRADFNVDGSVTATDMVELLIKLHQ